MSRLIAILLLPGLGSLFLCAPAFGQAERVDTGELDGAPYRVQIPADWNHGLVVYAHGYLPRGASWRPMSAAMAGVFLGRGFAVAESGYSRQGWAVEEAIDETEALRQYFSRVYGEPESTFVTGGSMGGLITLAAVEMHPEAYDGALPLCGPLVPALAFVKERFVDMLVTFEALFGAALSEEARPLLEAPSLPPEAFGRALESDSLAADRFAVEWGVRREDLPGILSFYHLAYREIVDRAGGNPVDNRSTVYSGFSPSDSLNDRAPRCTEDPEAKAYLVRHYTPTGHIEDPVLALHTTYDPGVPPALPSSYGVTAALAGNERRFVQTYVEADGHCNFTPDQIGCAFDRLRAWAATGVAPEPGALR